MAIGKNEYKNLYSLTLESGSCIRDYENFYLISKYSKKELIEHFKKFVEESEELSEDFKKFIKTTDKINYRMIYASYYETSCSIYYDQYVIDGMYEDYIGTCYHSTIRDYKYSPVLDIFRSVDGSTMQRAEEDIDIITNSSTLDVMFDQMVERERDKWEQSGARPFSDTRDIRKATWHVPMLIIGYVYENENYFSCIHAVNLLKYIAGPYNEAKALDILTKKASEGDVNAQYELGILHRKNNNFKDAFICFENASKHNYNAMVDLGNCYYNAQGVERDYKKAFDCYLKSAKKDHSVAYFNLANCYRNGFGCEYDIEKALDCLRKSEKLGYSRATQLIEFLQNDDKTKNDVKVLETINEVNKLCEYHISKIKELETSYRLVETQDFSYTYYDNKHTNEYQTLLQAHQNGNGKASYYLGVMIENIYGNGCNLSLEYFHSAVKNGYPLGLLHIARYTYENTEENYEKILELYDNFIDLIDSKWFTDFKEYLSLASFEAYLLVKKYDKKNTLKQYYYLYKSAICVNKEARSILGKSKSNAHGLYYFALYLNDWDKLGALKPCLKSAKKGFIKAQFLLAELYEYFNKTDKAKKWYKKVVVNKDNSFVEYNQLKADAQLKINKL